MRAECGVLLLSRGHIQEQLDLRALNAINDWILSDRAELCGRADIMSLF